MPSAVTVCVRTRPTASFAQDNMIVEDNQVSVRMPRATKIPDGSLNQPVLKKLLPPAADGQKMYIWENRVDSARLHRFTFQGGANCIQEP